jgi:hypothetical protein
MLKHSLDSWGVLTLWNQHQKEMLPNVHRISHDPVYPVRSYCKIKVLSTQKMHVNSLWFWTVSKYKMCIIQSTINNSHYHPNPHHNVCLCACFLGVTTFGCIFFFFLERFSLLIHVLSRSHTTQHIPRTHLDEWSISGRDLYPTTHNTHDKYPCPGGIPTHNLSSRAAVDLRLRPRGHWDRHTAQCITAITNYIHCAVCTVYCGTEKYHCTNSF